MYLSTHSQNRRKFRDRGDVLFLGGLVKQYIQLVEVNPQYYEDNSNPIDLVHQHAPLVLRCSDKPNTTVMLQFHKRLFSSSPSCNQCFINERLPIHRFKLLTMDY